ncbi:hypothetical protein [Burkholderia sp. LMG 21824]|uniref:hypothetical protein n=1 Tax=Burkholderia sp. LMG 21824 TaxID=3158172 RepID=UPI003C2DD0CD
MTTRTHYWVGVVFTVLYILIASAQSVALNAWLHSVNVFLVVGLSFSIVTVVFSIVGVARQRYAYADLLSRWRFLCALNLVSVTNWLLYFFAVKYLEPSVAVTLTQGVGPVSMTLYMLLQRKRVTATTRVCHGIILVAAAGMCAYVLAYRDVYSPYSRFETLMGMGLAVACSISITATVLISKRFAAHQVPAAALLSLRFPLLVVVCAAALPLQHDLRMTADIFATILLVALVGVCGSTYCLQKGIEFAPSLAVSTVLALSPLAVFLIQLSNARAPFSLPIFALIVTIVIVSIISIVYDARRIGTHEDAIAAKIADPAQS